MPWPHKSRKRKMNKHKRKKKLRKHRHMKKPWS